MATAQLFCFAKLAGDTILKLKQGLSSKHTRSYMKSTVVAAEYLGRKQLTLSAYNAVPMCGHHCVIEQVKKTCAVPTQGPTKLMCSIGWPDSKSKGPY